ncbi:MAG: flagellar biosynthesis repressor FlbT [Pseudomonadota bacterium]
MPGLILKLRAHEQILVNGVVMQNGERNTRLIIKTPDAKILRLRDAIHPNEVNTPVKRVCYIAQLAVAGEADADASLRELEKGIGQLRDALSGLTSCAALDDAARELDQRNFYGCLRRLRQLLPVEEQLLKSQSGPIRAASHLNAAPRSQATPLVRQPTATAAAAGGRGAAEARSATWRGAGE